MQLRTPSEPQRLECRLATAEGTTSTPTETKRADRYTPTQSQLGPLASCLVLTKPSSMPPLRWQTFGAIAQRDGSGDCAFIGITATSLESGGNLDIDCLGDITISGVNAGATYIGRAINPLEIRGDVVGMIANTIDTYTGAGDLALRCTVGAAFALEVQNLCTSFALSYEQKASGAGSELAITGQQGAAGAIGGKVRIASGKGGTPGTNQGGTIQLELAQQASGATDYLYVSEGATNFIGIRRIATTAYIESLSSGLTLTSPSDIGFNAATNGVFRCATAFFDQGTLYWRTAASATRRIDTIAAAYVQAYDAAVTSFTETLGLASAVRSKTWTDGSTAARVDEYHASVTTTDATVTTCGSVTITNSQVAHVTVEVCGYSGATLAASYERKATFRATAGTATLIGSVTSVHTAEDAAGWDCTLDASGATARVRVTGAAATTIRWESKIRVTWSK